MNLLFRIKNRLLIDIIFDKDCAIIFLYKI